MAQALELHWSGDDREITQLAFIYEKIQKSFTARLCINFAVTVSV